MNQTTPWTTALYVCENSTTNKGFANLEENTNLKEWQQIISKPTPKQITNQPTWESGSSLRTSLCGTRSLRPFVWLHHRALHKKRDNKNIRNRALHKKEKIETLKTGLCTMFCRGEIGYEELDLLLLRKMRLDFMKISLINAPLVIKHTHAFCAHQQHIKHTPPPALLWWPHFLKITCLLAWHEEGSPFDGICSGFFFDKSTDCKVSDSTNSFISILCLGPIIIVRKCKDNHIVCASLSSTG